MPSSVTEVNLKIMIESFRSHIIGMLLFSFIVGPTILFTTANHSSEKNSVKVKKVMKLPIPPPIDLVRIQENEGVAVQLLINNVNSCRMKKSCYLPDHVSLLVTRLIEDEKRAPMRKWIGFEKLAAACLTIEQAGYGHMSPSSCDLG